MEFLVPDLKELAVMQEELDKRIINEQGIDFNTSNLKIIAFKVEFGEFLNEVRFFKFWSKDRTPRESRKIKCPKCNGFGRYRRENEPRSRYCPDCDNPGGGMKTVYPMLEEFVDGIHFLLSIGIERKYIKWIHAIEVAEVDDKSLEALSIDIFNNPMNSAGKWLQCFTDYLHLGQLVGLYASDIETAYKAKNQINHTRQEMGY